MKLPGSIRETRPGSWEWRRSGMKGMTIHASSKVEAEWLAMRIILDNENPTEGSAIMPKQALAEWTKEHDQDDLDQREITGVTLFITFVKDVPLKDVDGSHVYGWWTATQKAKGWANGNVLRNLTFIKKFFKWSWGKGYTKRNPVDDCPEKPKQDKTKKKVFTAEDRERVLAELLRCKKEMLAKLFVLTFWQGFRLDSARNLKWQDINWDHPQRPQLRITTGKTEATRQMYWIEDKTIEVLSMYRKDRGYVFQSPDLPNRPYAKQAFYAMRDSWNRKVADEFKLPTAKTHGRAWHIGRHTFVTLKLKKGLNYATVAKLGGYENGQVLAKVYEHLSVDDVLEGID